MWHRLSDAQTQSPSNIQLFKHNSSHNDMWNQKLNSSKHNLNWLNKCSFKPGIHSMSQNHETIYATYEISTPKISEPSTTPLPKRWGLLSEEQHNTVSYKQSHFWSTQGLSVAPSWLTQLWLFTSTLISVNSCRFASWAAIYPAPQCCTNNKETFISFLGLSVSPKNPASVYISGWS